MSASISACLSFGRRLIAAYRSPRPLFGSTPTSLKAAACLSKTSRKNVRTATPKMIGSETFIIVALRWMENSTPCCLASSICASRKLTSAPRLMNVPSSTSPAFSAILSFRTVTVPLLSVNSIRTVVASGTVTDFSLVAKSPRLMVATCAFESGVQRPSLCGCFLAYSFTAAAARRSELPSRSTGFTALPSTLP